MCEPTTIALGLAVISAAAATKTQVDAKNAQEDQNKLQFDNSVLARSENANQVNLARGQQTDAASQKIAANNIAQREAQAAVVAQGGPSGLSVDALLGSIGGRGATFNSSVNANLDSANRALDNQLVNVNRNAASEINALKAPTNPDFLGSALRIGSAGNNFYAANSKRIV